MTPIDAEAKIPCPTPQHLQAELENLARVLTFGEKEDTWEKLEKAVIRFAGVTRGGGYKYLPQYVEGVGRKGVGMQLAACMLSDRGRLSGVAIELLQTLAPRLAGSFQTLVSLYLEPLIKLLGRPNKVFLKRAEKCLITVISHCQLPSILPELKRGLYDDAATCRRGCASGLERVSREWSKELIGERGVVVLEEALRKMATDKDPEVRQISKRVWARFSEGWPERVDDFSAPLTPTIRRYLDIPNPAADPSRAKIAMRPAAAAVSRPVSAASSASSTAAPIVPNKPQHARAQALASRPLRCPADPVPEAAVGPSLQRSPPRKKEEVVNTAALSPTRAEPSRPPLSKSVSAGPGQPFEPHFALGRHGRSVSHNILPTSSFTTSGPSSPTEPAKHNPLTKPSRPHLPASFSSISLPADPSDNVQPQPPRRFAPPTRIVRPAPLPLAEEDGAEEEPLDYLYQTPSGATVLRNPQRLLPGGQSDRWAAVGLGKRPVALGQAQRRVITAPGGIAQSLVVPFRTPGDGNRTLSGTGKEPAKDLEESKPQEATSYFDHVPVTSTSSSSSLTSAQPQADSPLMPVMVKSASTSAASSQSSETLAEDPVEELLKVEEDMADLTVLASDEAFGQEAIEMTVPKSMTSLPMGVVEVVTEDEAPPRGVKKDEATEDVALASAIPLPADEEPNLRGSGETALGLQSGQISTESKSEIAPAISSEADQETDTATVPIAEPSPSAVLDASSILPGTESSVPAGTAKPEIQPRAKVELPPGNIRKPPVPTMPRAITAQVDRKPFKPTARPVTGTSAPTKQTAGGADTAKITSSTSSALTKPVTTAVAPMFKANPVASVPPIPSAKPHVPLVANVTKPTASTAAKASAKPEQPKPTLKPTMPPAKAHPQITLPPVRKEKVRLKAPLPSFVPTRGKVKGSNGPLSSSTTSIGEKKAIVAKFRPEAISLPLSPAQKAKLPPEQIPLPRSPITMDSHLIPTSETLPALTKNHAGFVSQLSPTSDSLAEQNSRALPFAKLINISSPLLNGIGLPVDRFDSVSSRYASSKASTAPPMSSDGEEDEDGLSGITFKSTTAQTHGQVRPKFGAAQLVGGADLMEFSAPSRPALAPRSDVSTPAKSAEVLLAKIAGSTTPKSTPITGRAALSERDPNVGERRERMGEGVSI